MKFHPFLDLGFFLFLFQYHIFFQSGSKGNLIYKRRSVRRIPPIVQSQCPDVNICPLQILLVSDYFYAFLRREHHLTNGLYLKRKDGSEATLILK